MSASLVEIYRTHKTDSQVVYEFLQRLERNIADDLWKSVGGHWSQASIEHLRQQAVEKLIALAPAEEPADLQRAWIQVIRDFHLNQWGERRLAKKELKPKTEEQKIFREMFLYIWIAAQAFIVTKTIALYFGINSVLDHDDSGRIWLYLTIAWSFCSLMWFAYSQSKKQTKQELEKLKK